MKFATFTYAYGNGEKFSHNVNDIRRIEPHKALVTRLGFFSSDLEIDVKGHYDDIVGYLND